MSAETTPPAAAAPTPHTILLVDDEPTILSALRRNLSREGYRLLLANDGEEALATLEREAVDILVSDIDMPRMSGLELLRRVRERWPAVIRIVLTGGGSLDAAVRSINEGEVHRFLTKPWSREGLIETLRSTVARLNSLRAPAREEALARAQASLREELAAEFPGVLDVDRHEGVYLVDDARVGGLLRALPLESREAFEASKLESDEGATRVSSLGQFRE